MYVCVCCILYVYWYTHCFKLSISLILPLSIQFSVSVPCYHTRCHWNLYMKLQLKKILCHFLFFCFRRWNKKTPSTIHWILIIILLSSIFHSNLCRFACCFFVHHWKIHSIFHTRRIHKSLCLFFVVGLNLPSVYQYFMRAYILKTPHKSVPRARATSKRHE